jgi:Fe-S cluster assembly protein SufD
LVLAEAGSALTLVEDFFGASNSDHFNNSVTEIWADDNAQVTHVRLQREGTGTFHIAKTAITQGRDSRYTAIPVTLGARLSRHNLEVYQTGPQTDTNLYGLTAIAGSQLADTHSLVALNHPHGTADQLHKCIVDDAGHCVFNGRVWVPHDAQLTNASQLNRNLLLSGKARVDTKPELDIVADNVKCAHGATVSQLDANEVFYLQSRGISAEAAQRLLIYGFAMDIIDRIPIPSLKQTLTDIVTQRSS